MNCSDVRDALEAYIADDLTDAEQAKLAAHLATCDECTAAYERTRAVVADLKGIADALVPKERFVPQPTYAPRPVGGWGWRIAAVAASVLALLAMSALTVRTNFPLMFAHESTPPRTQKACGPSRTSTGCAS